jgi:hypothetical protein
MKMFLAYVARAALRNAEIIGVCADEEIGSS